MKPRHFVLAPLLLPTLRPAEALTLPEAQRYDSGYQIYQEDGERMHIESFYFKGLIDINADTSLRFQYLHDAISGSSPTGTLPSESDFVLPMHDVRQGILGALARQFGDHRVEVEISHSTESDYQSNGYSLSDTWDLNQKNTTLAFGINYLSDEVSVLGIAPQDKRSIDFFTGLTQILDKNTVVSANLTLGYNYGYLNDPYKLVSRHEILPLRDGDGGFYDSPIVNSYHENRPDHRFREVLQLQGTHFFEPCNAALDAIYRLSNDDFGVFSQSIQLEWRQAIGEKFAVTPYFRYYRQTAADFFMNTLDGVFPLSYTPPRYPNGSSPNYSADYRLSALDSLSLGLRLTYQFCDNFSASVSYERYQMHGLGSNAAPSATYPSADIWSCCAYIKF
ncbi:MAG: DUF3570 domain-containing protein [Verrucomicrobiota bacterium]